MKCIKYHLLFALTSMLIALPVFADESDLVVEFESDPLFSEANVLPGNDVTRFVNVTNNAGASQDIIVEAINVSDPDGFGSVLDLLIEENGDELFSGSLADFFDAGEVSLSSVAGSGGETAYDFTVSFSEGANNTYQGKSLGFDIIVGFKGDEGGGGGDVGGSGGSGGGGGGGGGGGNGPPVQGLVIQNESTVSVSETTATIVWNTSFQATSRVVYDTAAGLFDFNDPPNYGYSNSTAEFNTPANTNGVTLHEVTITGLTPGTSYYYRTISHASPDTISLEHGFTTLTSASSQTNSSTGEMSGEEMGAVGSSETGAFFGVAASPVSEEDIATGSNENLLGASDVQETLGQQEAVAADDSGSDTFGMAAVIFGLGSRSWLIILLILLFVVLMLYIITRRRS